MGVERLDEQPRVGLLATGAGTEEAVQLVLDRASELCRLALQDVPGAQLALFLDHCFDDSRAERADKLALEVGLAGEEAQLLEPCTIRDKAMTRSLEAAAEVTLLWCVVESRETWPAGGGLQVPEEAPHLGGATQVDHLDHLFLQVPSLSRGQREQGSPVTGSLDEDEGSR